MIKKLTSSWAIAALILICLASFGLMLWASRTDSAIDDELAHIPAGYGYVHNLDYRLNPEHPPLIKALAMLPVLFLNPVFPTDTASWQTDVNGQWGMGTEFLYESGNDANAIIMTARIMPILITILLIVLIYIFARRVMGNLWALLPTFLFAFDPTVLAHGHYVTTDIGGALGVILATYFFLKFIETPSTRHLWYAGIAFGIAQITKFSTPLLIPLFIFLVLTLWLKDLISQWSVTDASRRFKTFFMRFCRSAGKLALIFLIGYAIIVYPIYFAFTAGYPAQKQAADTQVILGSFASGPTPAGQMCHGLRCIADADIWMAAHRITQPIAEYVLGVLMVMQRSAGGNTIYFMGHVQQSGGWAYFPLLFLLKEPLPTLIIILFALVLAIWWMIKKRGADFLTNHFTEFSMLSFIILYWGYSMHSPLNIGIRHLMPTIPFIFILAALAWKKWIMQLNFEMPGGFTLGAVMGSAKTFLHSIISSIVKYLFLVLLLIWLAVETFVAAPYFLSYFNELGGGVWGGYHYVTDSNYDWGQDLLRLQDFVNQQKIDKIAVDYFGGGNPKYYLGDKEVDWSSSKGNPADQGIHWIAISVNTLEGALQPLAVGPSRSPSDTYSWLTALHPISSSSETLFGGTMGNVPTPDYRIGTSIFVYHL